MVQFIVISLLCGTLGGLCNLLFAKMLQHSSKAENLTTQQTEGVTSVIVIAGALAALLYGFIEGPFALVDINSTQPLPKLTFFYLGKTILIGFGGVRYWLTRLERNEALNTTKVYGNQMDKMTTNVIDPQKMMKKVKIAGSNKVKKGGQGPC